MDTEVFGPVAAIVTFDDEDEAVAAANDTEFGLAALFTQNLDRAPRVSERLESGMTGLNTELVSNPAAPFGGTPADEPADVADDAEFAGGDHRALLVDVELLLVRHAAPVPQDGVDGTVVQAVPGELPSLRAGSDRGMRERFTRCADRMVEGKEFFIRKAIGWVLREISKQDSVWTARVGRTAHESWSQGRVRGGR